LAIEFDLRCIPFKAKNQLQVFYKGRRLDTCYIPDFVVHEQIVVELKATKELAAEHEAQLMNYMRITRHPVGYIVNFAPVARVQWKRFVISEFLKINSDPIIGKQIHHPTISVH
jgi:GxxExxY protein